MPDAVTFAELFGGVFPAEGDVRDAVVYGPLGNDLEGTLAEATLANQEAIIAAIAALPTAVTNAEAVWDRVLTGNTHNIASSAGRRLRGLQDFGVYSGGAVWIDTVEGTAGTVEFENGTVTNPSDNLQDATEIAEALNLRHFHMANGSNITMAQAYDFYEFAGDEYTVALGGQSINNTSIRSALLISGTYSGFPHILHSIIGNIIGPGAKLGMCAIRNAVVLNANTNVMVMHDCWTSNASLAAMDFGADVAGSVAYLQNYNGDIEIRNLQTGDTLWHSGRGKVTLAASCTGGTVNIAGTIELVDNSTGVTINEIARVDSESGGVTLTGPNDLTVTVTDSDTSDPIEAAIVRLYRSGETGSQATDDDGVTVFGLAAATWSYAVSAAGYSSKTGTIVVSSDGALAVELDAIVVATPDDPSLATLTVKCLDELGAIEAGAVVYLRLTGIPTGSVGLSFDGISQEATANGDGNASLTIVKLAKYQIRRGASQQWKDFTATSEDSQTVTSFIGVDPVVE